MKEMGAAEDTEKKRYPDPRFLKMYYIGSAGACLEEYFPDKTLPGRNSGSDPDTKRQRGY